MNLKRKFLLKKEISSIILKIKNSNEKFKLKKKPEIGIILKKLIQ